MSGNSECQFYVWAILAFLGLALVISLIFNVSYYLESHRKHKTNTYYNDYVPRSLKNSSCENEDFWQIQDLTFREDENYIEDTPIYGNLDNVIPETMDENCYEQMKARPESSVKELQEANPPAQESREPETFYASLDHSKEGQRRKARKQKTCLSENKDMQLHEMTAVASSSTSLVEIEDDIHDDPARLFGLIRAKREITNEMNYDLAQ